ncbi:HAD family hydrolase [Thiorhodovibrio frisius]|uniref:phosphoglycolate phosphatase n=1 Tax=Thiorhodovibrio frisius TaxID=631362 RepID=H8Z1Q3_9GAMM|nr:HAD hydrolase-like protein [Thiorhodovibrio frisius]EIC21498.1 putative phosphatase [Thiorhodovibrio frisius]WPL24084.1 phosphoglycolate phosphatase [Thiorhodovibrio frisius]
MYSDDRLVILDADGTTIDAFRAIEKTFNHHSMDIGPLARFQKRRNIFKYLGGFKEMPQNLRQQIGWQKRTKLVATLTEVYREEARMFDGIEHLIHALAEAADVKVGIVTRNITNDPLSTLHRLFERHGLDHGMLDFLVHLPLSEHKLPYFRELRERFKINPARAYACGDEVKDYRAAVGTGMHPFMVSYGFEDFERLHVRHEIPAEVILPTPDALAERVTHALGLRLKTPRAG